MIHEVKDIANLALLQALSKDKPAAEAIAAAQTATEAAATAVEAAEDAEDVLENIPQDYSTLSSDVTDLKSALDDTLKPYRLPANTDLNNLTSPGVYALHTSYVYQNIPPRDHYESNKVLGFLEVWEEIDITVTPVRNLGYFQRATLYRNDGTIGIWARRYSAWSSTWLEWNAINDTTEPIHRLQTWNTDLNDITGQGVYGIHGAVPYENCPVENGTLEVWEELDAQGNLGRVFQRITEYGNSNNVFIRFYSTYSSTWSNWAKCGEIQTGFVVSLSSYGDLSTPSGFVSAFQSAMSDNLIHGISIPFGTYELNAELEITRSSFIIDGNGATLIPALNCNAFRLRNKNHISIKNLIIDMNQDKNATYGTGLMIADGSDLEFRNITIKNIGYQGIIIWPSDNDKKNLVENVIFDNIHLEGIEEVNVHSNERPFGIIAVNIVNGVIKNCYVSNMPSYSLEYKNFVGNAIMSDNIVENCTRGIMIGCDRDPSEDQTSNSMTFTGNIVNNTEIPLFLFSVENVTATGNVLLGKETIISRCKNAVISGNIFKMAEGYNGSLFRIDGCEDIMLCNNRYEMKSTDTLIRTVEGTTNLIVNGMMNDRWIHVVNPSSGTPS